MVLRCLILAHLLLAIKLYKYCLVFQLFPIVASDDFKWDYFLKVYLFSIKYFILHEDLTTTAAALAWRKKLVYMIFNKLFVRNYIFFGTYNFSI